MVLFIFWQAYYWEQFYHSMVKVGAYVRSQRKQKIWIQTLCTRTDSKYQSSQYICMTHTHTFLLKSRLSSKFLPCLTFWGGCQSWSGEGQCRFFFLPLSLGFSQSCVSLLLRLQEREWVFVVNQGSLQQHRCIIIASPPVFLLIIIFMLMNSLQVEMEIIGTSGIFLSLLQFFFN